MQKNTFQNLTIFVAAIIFTFLFYKQEIGLNLFIFEILILIYFIIKQRINFKNLLHIIIFCAGLISTFSVLLFGTTYVLLINIFIWIFVLGISLSYELKMTYNALGLGILNLIFSFGKFFDNAGQTKIGRFKTRNIFRYIKIIILPIIIVIIFISIYKNANLVFEKHWMGFWDSINEFLIGIFKNFNFAVVWVYILGCMISIMFLIPNPEEGIISKDQNTKLFITRTRKQRWTTPKVLAIKNEYKAAIFLLVILNLLILFVNIIDINWVWINFEWQGEYLKQFVHEGTYLLILSILISIGIVLFYFRGNLNFYSKNKTLKILAFIWLGQNAFMTLSVMVRNFHYINHFNLAYKRIAVLFFLGLVIFGILTVILKIRHKRSAAYLFKINILAIVSLFSISSIINWDSFIAKYNMNHYESAFLHYDYLIWLNPTSIPHYLKSEEQIVEIKEAQEKVFKFDFNYMKTDEFFERIENKKAKFIRKYSRKDWKSITIAEQKTYKYLMQH